MYKITIQETLILNFGGYFVSLLGGLTASYTIGYPIAWLFYLPGWTMMGIAFATILKREKTDHAK